MPIFHECQRRRACCRWPGDVRLSHDEITRLTAFQGLEEKAFFQKFTRLAQASAKAKPRMAKSFRK